MSDADNLRAWEEWEADWNDQVRVRGYFVALCRAIEHAKRNVEAATDRLERARLDAESAVETLRIVVERAEAVSHVMASGDAEWVSEVASAIEGCFG